MAGDGNVGSVDAQRAAEQAVETNRVDGRWARVTDRSDPLVRVSFDRDGNHNVEMRSPNNSDWQSVGKVAALAADKGLGPAALARQVMQRFTAGTSGAMARGFVEGREPFVQAKLGALLRAFTPTGSPPPMTARGWASELASTVGKFADKVPKLAVANTAHLVFSAALNERDASNPVAIKGFVEKLRSGDAETRLAFEMMWPSSALKKAIIKEWQFQDSSA